ncbi:MAG: hypothetical protein IPH43_14350, partial [Xanthomonadales bacterium]|nr:hypothetical protein [Xanthomonadales bacterium]
EEIADLMPHMDDPDSASRGLPDDDGPGTHLIRIEPATTPSSVAFWMSRKPPQGIGVPSSKWWMHRRIEQAVESARRMTPRAGSPGSYPRWSRLPWFAAPVHSGNARLECGSTGGGSAIMEIVERFRVVIQLPGMRIRRRPAWTLPHALVLASTRPSSAWEICSGYRLPA